MKRIVGTRALVVSLAVVVASALPAAGSAIAPEAANAGERARPLSAVPYGERGMMRFGPVDRAYDDDDWGWDHMDWDDGWWIVMGLGMILFWALVVVGIVWVVRTFMGDRARHAGGRPESALEILDRRLAEGAISPEEYRERRHILRGGGEAR